MEDLLLLPQVYLRVRHLASAIKRPLPSARYLAPLSIRKETIMVDKTVARGDLYFLWHPAAPTLCSGYGLVVHDGDKQHLVGLLMVDCPGPVPTRWLAKVEQTLGNYTLVPTTAPDERSIICHMYIGADSLIHVERRPQAIADEIQTALLPLLDHPPRPSFQVRWDAQNQIWKSSFFSENNVAQTQQLRPLFSLGQVVATPGALDALATTQQTPMEFLYRHVSGDWGSLDIQDIQTNEEALLYDNRLMSAYTLADATRIWVITEWDRSVTTILLPSEY